MECISCESDARGVCAFFGRAVCKDHMRTKEIHSGFGQKIKDNLWPSGSDTGVTVADAVWCGECRVQYHWVTVGGEDVLLACPDGGGWRDLEALGDAGALVRVSQRVNPQDDRERESQYDVAASDAGPGAAPDRGSR